MATASFGPAQLAMYQQPQQCMISAAFQAAAAAALPTSPTASSPKASPPNKRGSAEPAGGPERRQRCSEPAYHGQHHHQQQQQQAGCGAWQPCPTSPKVDSPFSGFPNCGYEQLGTAPPVVATTTAAAAPPSPLRGPMHGAGHTLTDLQDAFLGGTYEATACGKGAPPCLSCQRFQVYRHLDVHKVVLLEVLLKVAPDAVSPEALRALVDAHTVGDIKACAARALVEARTPSSSSSSMGGRGGGGGGGAWGGGAEVRGGGGGSGGLSPGLERSRSGGQLGGCGLERSSSGAGAAVQAEARGRVAAAWSKLVGSGMVWVQQLGAQVDADSDKVEYNPSPAQKPPYRVLRAAATLPTGAGPDTTFIVTTTQATPEFACISGSATPRPSAPSSPICARTPPCSPGRCYGAATTPTGASRPASPYTAPPHSPLRGAASVPGSPLRGAASVPGSPLRGAASVPGSPLRTGGGGRRLDQRTIELRVGLETEAVGRYVQRHPIAAGDRLMVVRLPLDAAGSDIGTAYVVEGLLRQGFTYAGRKYMLLFSKGEDVWFIATRSVLLCDVKRHWRRKVIYNPPKEIWPLLGAPALLPTVQKQCARAELWASPTVPVPLPPGWTVDYVEDLVDPVTGKPLTDGAGLAHPGLWELANKAWVEHRKAGGEQAWDWRKRGRGGLAASSAPITACCPLQMRLHHRLLPGQPRVVSKGTLSPCTSLLKNTIQLPYSCVKAPSKDQLKEWQQEARGLGGPGPECAPRNTSPAERFPEDFPEAVRLELNHCGLQVGPARLTQNLMLLLAYWGLDDAFLAGLMQQELQAVDQVLQSPANVVGQLRQSELGRALRPLKDRLLAGWGNLSTQSWDARAALGVDQHLRDELRRMQLLMYGSLRELQLPVKDAHRAMGVPDHTRSLPPDCVVLLDKDGRDMAACAEQRALLYRDPDLDPHGVLAVTLVQAPPALRQGFGDVRNVLIMSIQGVFPMADLMAGGDYDGDTFTVITHPHIVARCWYDARRELDYTQALQTLQHPDDDKEQQDAQDAGREDAGRERQDAPPAHQSAPPAHQHAAPAHQHAPPAHQHAPLGPQHAPPAHQHAASCQAAGNEAARAQEQLRSPSAPPGAAADGGRALPVDKWRLKRAKGLLWLEDTKLVVLAADFAAQMAQFMVHAQSSSGVAGRMQRNWVRVVEALHGEALHGDAARDNPAAACGHPVTHPACRELAEVYSRALDSKKHAGELELSPPTKLLVVAHKGLEVAWLNENREAEAPYYSRSINSRLYRQVADHVQAQQRELAAQGVWGPEGLGCMRCDEDVLRQAQQCLAACLTDPKLKLQDAWERLKVAVGRVLQQEWWAKWNKYLEQAPRKASKKDAKAKAEATRKPRKKDAKAKAEADTEHFLRGLTTGTQLAAIRAARDLKLLRDDVHLQLDDVTDAPSGGARIYDDQAQQDSLADYFDGRATTALAGAMYAAWYDHAFSRAESEGWYANLGDSAGGEKTDREKREKPKLLAVVWAVAGDELNKLKGTLVNKKPHDPVAWWWKDK